MLKFKALLESDPSVPVVILVLEYLHRLLGDVSVADLHNALYLLKAAGGPLAFEFECSHTGPYSPDLHWILLSMEGITMHGYAGEGCTAYLALTPEKDAAERVIEYLDDATANATADSLAKLAVLFSTEIEGEESPSLTLLSFGHFVAMRALKAAVRTGMAITYQQLETVVAEVLKSWDHGLARDEVSSALCLLQKAGWLPECTSPVQSN